MNATLVVDDPLVGREATIVITLAASTQPREERPSLISVGAAGQMPVIRSGTFGNMPALIHEAWTAFGARAQADGTTAKGETAAEEQLAATANADDNGPTPTAQPSPAMPKPKNLSLF